MLVSASHGAPSHNCMSTAATPNTMQSPDCTWHARTFQRWCCVNMPSVRMPRMSPCRNPNMWQILRNGVVIFVRLCWRISHRPAALWPSNQRFRFTNRQVGEHHRIGNRGRWMFVHSQRFVLDVRLDACVCACEWHGRGKERESEAVCECGGWGGGV